MRALSFPKSERLTLRRETDALFVPGTRSASVYPVRAVFRTLPADPSVPQARVLVSVAKRHLRHAVSRNRAKRQLREAWRLNKSVLTDCLPPGTALHVALIWLSDRPQVSARVAKSVAQLLRIIAESLPTGETEGEQ